MIKFFPPRKSKDIYSIGLISEIANDLGIKDPEKISDLKEILEQASLSYQKSKKNQARQYTETKEDKELIRFSKSIEKSHRILKDLFDVSLGSSFRFIDSIRNLKTAHLKEKSALYELIHEKEFFIDKKTILSLLEIISLSAKSATKSDHIFTKQTDTEIVFNWLCEFSDFWEAFSKITISEGREYDSPAIRIIIKIIEPINKTVIAKDIITPSLISEAIRIHRKNSNPDSDFNPFTDDPADIGQ